MKRLTDIFFASILLLLLLIPMICIAIWIKCDTPGPVLFKQQRIGQFGRSFTIYKFRTMRVETPNVATDALQNALSFITKSGAFLRKTSLDELPQLWNILKGDMSFVGPRPALYNQYTLIEMRNRQNVHLVKPGLTGYAQINGRDFISDELKVLFDQHYVQHRCFLLDAKIAIKTITHVLRRENIS